MPSPSQRPVASEPNTRELIVDVRTAEEFAQSHVPGAKNIPLHELQVRLAELGPKHTSLVLYCRSGARSATAAALLERAGFTRVRDIGAMSNWPRR